MSEPRHFSEVSRPVQLGAGAILGVFGLTSLAFFVLSVVSLWGVRPQSSASVLFALTFFLAIGCPSCFYSFRLLTGHPRPDGDRVLPGLLRLAGTLLFLFSAFALMQRDWAGVGLSLLHAGAGAACFVLSGRREGVDGKSRVPVSSSNTA